MSNKLASLFALVIFFATLWGGYYYFFKLNTGNLTLDGNLGEYEVSLYAQNIKTPFHSHCRQTHCELIDLAPFTYTLTITSPGYKKSSFDIVIPKRDTLKMSFSLEKEMSMRAIPSSTGSASASGSNTPQLERLKNLAFLKHTYTYFDLQDRGFYYFLDNFNDTLSLYKKGQDDLVIAFFPTLPKKQIDLQKVYGTSDEIGIIMGHTLYLYNTVTGRMYKTTLPATTFTLKKFSKNYGLTTASGMYLYQPETNKKESFSLFDDFVYYGQNTYIGLVRADQKDKKELFHLRSSSSDVIVNYDLLKKKVISSYETPQKVLRLTIEGTGAYYYDSSETKYAIENLDS